MERNPENIEARNPFEMRPVFCRLSAVRALGAIAIKGTQIQELAYRPLF